MSIPNKDNQSSKKPRGQILKEARAVKGVTIEAAHDATKIPMDVLRAIEEGYTVRTLSSFYLAGFIKMYAQYLGVDVQDVLVAEEHHEEKLPEVKPQRRLGEEIEDRATQVFSQERQRLVVKIIGGLLLVFMVVKIGGCLQQGRRDGSARKKKLERIRKVQMERMAAARKKEEPKKKAVVVPSPKAPPPMKKEVPKKKKAAAPKKEKKPDKVHLIVKAGERGWLQVKVDGVLVFQSVLKQGVSETWEAKKEIEISGKSIHDLTYILNGKELKGLGRSDRNARRVVITPKGLSVKK